jgi:hypothetical protein
VPERVLRYQRHGNRELPPHRDRWWHPAREFRYRHNGKDSGCDRYDEARPTGDLRETGALADLNELQIAIKGHFIHREVLGGGRPL